MSYNSKQKESKQPFEQQLSYISESVFVYFANKGLTPTLTLEFLVFWQQCQMDFQFFQDAMLH